MMISDADIARLAEYAHDAGDEGMVELTEWALGCGVGINATDAQREGARKECAEFLADFEELIGDDECGPIAGHK